MTTHDYAHLRDKLAEEAVKWCRLRHNPDAVPACVVEAYDKVEACLKEIDTFNRLRER
jgi:hypothetical protein